MAKQVDRDRDEGRSVTSGDADLTVVPVLVFFMNPAGRPCQMQDQLLAESRAQWEPLADLRYARTDTEADRDLFYRYGVRALPTLVLVDPAGKELKRFPPGIQQPTTVLDGLKATR